mmetsp:Transcript_29790/g.93371  ORF Transcript_29790/g.93371 Transcript_29790/m.93371 type:complete len:295 (-) Transcript_29790:137-1021(-)
MVELVVRLVQREAALEALVLWDQRAVALPKGGAERRAPAHAPLGLVVAVVDRRVEDAGHPLRGRDVAAPQVAVQHRRLDVQPLEQVQEAVRRVERRLPLLAEAHVGSLTHLEADPLVAEELDPGGGAAARGPRVWLRRRADGVVDVEPEPALPRLLGQRLREVHLSHQPAELLLVDAPAHVHVLHDEKRAAVGAVFEGKHLWHRHRARGAERAEAERLAEEHGLERARAGRLDDQLLLVPLDGVAREAGPAAAAAHRPLRRDGAQVACDPPLRVTRNAHPWRAGAQGEGGGGDG